jgi:hypothetical protein
MANKRTQATAEKRRVKKSAARATVKRPVANGTRPEALIKESRSPSPLRGILPTTSEIEALVNETLADRPASPAARQRMVDDLKMQFHFGGYWIAYRHTDQGMEVLAVGMDEIGRLERKRMPRAEKERIVLRYCDPW